MSALFSTMNSVLVSRMLRTKVPCFNANRTFGRIVQNHVFDMCQTLYSRSISTSPSLALALHRVKSKPLSLAGWFPLVVNNYHANGLHITSPCAFQAMSFSSQSDQQWTETIRVKPFGEIDIRTGDLADIYVRPLSIAEFPHQDVVIVTSPRGGVVSMTSTQDVNDHVTVTPRSDVTSRQAHDACAVFVPIKFDIQAELAGERCFSLDRVESDSVNILMGCGDCHFTHIQGGDISVTSEEGDIQCKSLLQGNCLFTTAGLGRVSAHRVQGLTFDVETEAGDIQVKALYADESKITTKYGNVLIGSGHRQIKININEEGDLKIGSLDGSLTANVQTGNVDLYITRHSRVNITVNTGNISVKLPDSVDTQVDMRAQHVIISEDLDSSQLEREKDTSGDTVTGMLYGRNANIDGDYDLPVTESRSLRLEALNGVITVGCQDWLKSLNLGKVKDTVDEL